MSGAEKEPIDLEDLDELAGRLYHWLSPLYGRLAGLNTLDGTLRVEKPRTVTAAADTIGEGDHALIFNFAGIVTETLPDPTKSPGRTLRFRTITANTVISASANVVPLIGGAAGTAILAATAGKWADLHSDGVVWQIMAGN